MPTWSPLNTGLWLGLRWNKTAVVYNQALDPYLAWADATNGIDLDDGKKGWIQILLEFSTADPEITIERLRRVKINNKKVFMAPRRYWKPGNAAAISLRGKTRTVSAQVKPVFFRMLFNGYGGGGQTLWEFANIQRFQLALAVSTEDDESDFDDDDLNLAFFKSPRNVVVSVIDDGLAFSNAAVRDRLVFYWNQDDERNQGANFPKAFNYGSEYGKRKPGVPRLIDVWETNKGGQGKLDEEAVYAHAGLMQMRRKSTHGAAVLDVATRDLDDAAIVCVQLPTHTTMDTSGASLSPYVLDAMHYILGCAGRIAKANPGPAKRVPVVVNLSYGDIAGPHDGTSILEKAIDDFVSACKSLNPPQPIAVVIPAGNSHSSRCHAQFAVPATGQMELAWRIHPDDRTPSFMEVWLPAGIDGDKFVIAVIPPGETAGSDVVRGACKVWPDSVDPTCTVVFPKIPANSSGTPQRLMMLVAVSPTSSLYPRALAPAGLWKVVVKNTSATAATVDAWIQRDDSPYGYPRRGRQSYFEDSQYIRFGENWNECANDAARDAFDGRKAEPYVKRAGTLNAIATGTQTIVPAGHRDSDGRPAKYSSSGAPDPLLSQVSEDSLVHRGILAGGTHSGSVTAFGGTSIAAPQVANELARLLAAGHSSIELAQRSQPPDPYAELIPDTRPNTDPVAVDKGVVKVYAIPVAPPVGGSIPPPCDPRLGFGRVDRLPGTPRNRRRVP